MCSDRRPNYTQGFTSVIPSSHLRSCTQPLNSELINSEQELILTFSRAALHKLAQGLLAARPPSPG